MNNPRSQVRALCAIATTALLCLASLSHGHVGGHRTQELGAEQLGIEELNVGRPSLRIEDETPSSPTEVVGQVEGAALRATSGLSEDGQEQPAISNQLDMNNLPVSIERSDAQAFTLPNGETHWYETVYTPQGGINWVQARLFAEQAGGHLVSIHSEQENQFVFSLVEDPKFWFKFDHSEGLFVLSGPFLGGYQPQGAAEPDGGWRWASGEPWTYQRWQKANLDIGIKVAPDDQPNNNNGNQNVTAFGEVDLPMSYWSDVPHTMSTYDSGAPSCYGFIIEYNQRP